MTHLALTATLNNGVIARADITTSRFRSSAQFIVGRTGERFGAVVVFSEGNEHFLRISGMTRTDRVESDGNLKFKALVMEVVDEDRAIELADDWPLQDPIANRSPVVSLLQLKQDGWAHELPMGGTWNRRFAVVDKDGPRHTFTFPSKRIATYGPFGLRPETFIGLLGPFPAHQADVMRAEMRLGMGLDSFVPEGEGDGGVAMQGAGPGGWGVQITPWEEIVGEPAALEYCYLMALRMACRVDTVAVGGRNALPLVPDDFDDLHSFDSYAGTSDATRLPHLNKHADGPWNTGPGSPITPQLQKYEQFDDQHWSRGVWGLLGLIYHMPEFHPVRMWALETFLSRCAFLWNEIPDLPAAGTNWPGMIANGGTGWWDRDEGWCFHAALHLDYILSTEPAHLAEFATRAMRWHSHLRAGFVAATLPNGITQSVMPNDKHWTTNPYIPDEDGNALPLTDKKTYCFQTSIILAAAALSDRVRPELAALMPIVRKGWEFQSSRLVRSRYFEFNGGKMGFPDIFSAETVDGIAYQRIEHWRGLGVMTNELAVAGLVGDLATARALLGAADDSEAIEVIVRDSKSSASGNVKWSAVLAQRLVDGETEDWPYPPTPLPEPDPEPEPEQPNESERRLQAMLTYERRRRVDAERKLNSVRRIVS